MLTGDADQGDVMALEQFIIDVMSNGPASKWRIPIIPSGGDKDKRGMEWISFQNSNQDMQFSQWTELLWSGVSALFGVDLEELGIKTSKNTSLMSENLSPRIEESKSRGLGSILSFLQAHLQKILNMIDEDFLIEFNGYEKDDIQQKNANIEAELRSFKTVDEIRKENDLEPFEEEWSQIPLNDKVVQLVQSQQMGAAGGIPEGEEKRGERSQFGNGAGGEQADYGNQFRNLQFGENPEAQNVEKSIQDVVEIVI